MITGSKPRLTDVLWWTQPQDVLNEIGTIMELPSVTTNTPGWMNHRLTASKNILDAMTPDEKKILEGKAEAMGGHGLPEDVKRK